MLSTPPRSIILKYLTKIRIGRGISARIVLPVKCMPVPHHWIENLKKHVAAESALIVLFRVLWEEKSTTDTTATMIIFEFHCTFSTCILYHLSTNSLIFAPRISGGLLVLEFKLLLLFTLYLIVLFSTSDCPPSSLKGPQVLCLFFGVFIKYSIHHSSALRDPCCHTTEPFSSLGAGMAVEKETDGRG